MYKFKKSIDKVGFFFVSKEIIVDGTWAKLSHAGKAVLPVILKYRNKNGVAFPSQETIGILAGISEKTVSCGIKSITEFTDIDVKKYRTSKANVSYKYSIPSRMVKLKGGIRTTNALFDSGCWRMLSSTGKSLYFVLRTLAEPDKLDYHEDEEFSDFKEWYGQREYDLVAFQSISQLAKLAGISRPSMKKAVASLRKNRLLTDMDYDFNGKCSSQIINIFPEISYSWKSLNTHSKKNIIRKQKKL